MKDSVAAPKMLEALDGRLNSPPVWLLLFLAHAAIGCGDATNTRSKRVPISWWTLPALALLALGLVFPRAAQLYGNTFFATLLLFIGLSIELLHFKQQTAYTRSAGELSY